MLIYQYVYYDNSPKAQAFMPYLDWWERARVRENRVELTKY